MALLAGHQDTNDGCTIALLPDLHRHENNSPTIALLGGHHRHKINSCTIPRWLAITDTQTTAIQLPGGWPLQTQIIVVQLPGDWPS